MEIGETLPEVFNRTVPVIEPDTQIIVAVSQLLFHEVDALPIGFSPPQKKRHAVLGYSCLNKLLETSSNNYTQFLYSPCLDAAQELVRIKADDNIESFLRKFVKTQVGYAWVESQTVWGFASLLDSLELYTRELIESDMTVGETASPIFSLPGNKVEVALWKMLDRKFRRVFVEGKKRLFTDRQIIGRLFSSERLPLASKKPESFLDLRLSDIEAVKPVFVKESARVKVAADSIKKVKEQTLVCEKGVVTPWDLIVKPMDTGKLQIKR